MLRYPNKTRPIIAILAGTMLMVVLACAGDSATPTSEPTSPAGAAATAVPEATESVGELTWIQRYMNSPGYDPAWGEPKTGGTFVFGGNRDSAAFNPNSFNSGCYTHGCNAGLGFNGLLRIDVWQGKLDIIEGDLAESWDMSDDGLTLTVQLHEDVLFHDNPNVPAEYNGGKIRGDEFVCEDAMASYERMAHPTALETSISATRVSLSHLGSMTCPDGPRGHTFVMNFNAALARTVQNLAAGRSMGFSMLDKDYIEWINAENEAAGLAVLSKTVPDNFSWLTGTGAFVPEEITVGVSSEWVRNPNYWREGLPLLDKWRNIVIKDATTRFTALATGQIHFYGEGSYSLTAGQAEQALRDFPDKIIVHPQMNMWARTMTMNASRSPFNDGRVRYAMHLALDRQEWKEFRRVRVGSTVIEGTKLAFHLPPDTFYGPTEAELASWPGYTQPKDNDIAEANRLLDETLGPGNRPNMTCTAVAENPSDVDGCLFVIDQFNKNLGINNHLGFRRGCGKSPER